MMLGVCTEAFNDQNNSPILEYWLKVPDLGKRYLETEAAMIVRKLRWSGDAIEIFSKLALREASWPDQVWLPQQRTFLMTTKSVTYPPHGVLFRYLAMFPSQELTKYSTSEPLDCLVRSPIKPAVDPWAAILSIEASTTRRSSVTVTPGAPELGRYLQVPVKTELNEETTTRQGRPGDLVKTRIAHDVFRECSVLADSIFFLGDYRDCILESTASLGSQFPLGPIAVPNTLELDTYYITETLLAEQCFEPSRRQGPASPTQQPREILHSSTRPLV